MTAVYGLYETPEAAQRAFDSLKASGVSEAEIVVMSSQPLEGYAFADRDHKTSMRWIAVVGAVVGLIGAYLLTSVTQQAWAINTGGMPIVSHWTNLIVLFELTMLGAVFATVATLMVTARLPRRLPKFYDPQVSEGKILVGAVTTEITTVEAALRGGAALVKRINEL
jgi:hypothetical protein